MWVGTYSTFTVLVRISCCVGSGNSHPSSVSFTVPDIALSGCTAELESSTAVGSVYRDKLYCLPTTSTVHRLNLISVTQDFILENQLNDSISSTESQKAMNCATVKQAPLIANELRGAARRTFH